MEPLGPAVLLMARPRARLFHLVFGSHIGRALGADSGEKSGLASDIDTATVESLNALDPKRPIREGGFEDASTELEKTQADGGKLGGGENARPGDRVPYCQHKPIGGSGQDQPHTGERRTATGSVGGELGLVHLDQVRPARPQRLPGRLPEMPAVFAAVSATRAAGLP